MADRRRDKLRHGLRQGNGYFRQVCCFTFTVAIQIIPAPKENTDFVRVEGMINIPKGYCSKM